MSASAADWSVLDIEGVTDVIGQAARQVHRQYERFTERDDLYQEAMILVATKADLQEAARSEALGLGVLQHRLVMDLIDKIKTGVGHARRQVDYTAVVDNLDGLENESQNGVRLFGHLTTSGFRGGEEGSSTTEP